MIISIRGTNGSGKSTVVRELMGTAKSIRPLYGRLGTKDPEACELLGWGKRVFALGPYTTQRRGLDAITDYDKQVELVRDYGTLGHAIFEGFISGKLWGRVGAVLEELAPAQGVALLFLSTSLEECIRRVVTRRRQAGDTRPFNEKNLRAVYDQVQSNLAAVRKKHIKGLTIHEVSSEDAPALCLELLGVS
jgi:deoxyadenosine/deoxycytidine kinase